MSVYTNMRVAYSTKNYGFSHDSKVNEKERQTVDLASPVFNKSALISRLGIPTRIWPNRTRALIGGTGFPGPQPSLTLVSTVYTRTTDTKALRE